MRKAFEHLVHNLFDLFQANTWVTVSPGGTPPTARDYQSAVWDAGNNRMWIFGGFDDSPVLSVGNQCGTARTLIRNMSL